MARRDTILHCLAGLTAGSPGDKPDDLLTRAAEAARALVDGESAMAFATGQRRGLRACVSASRPPELLPTDPRGTEFARQIMRGAGPVRIDELARDPRAAVEWGAEDGGPALFVPLVSRDQGAGYVAVLRPRGARRFEAADVHALILLAAWLTTALDNLRLAGGLEKLAVTDDLTQVYNYRFLRTALRREIRRAFRFSQELSVVMIDVDNLKAYNDRNGHLRGSFLLKAIAGRLAEQLREFDLLAKYGGDEFTVILPQTGRDGAMTVAERLRRSICEHTFTLAPPGSISISLGVATFPHDGSDGNLLLRVADRALYRAKASGRNRVEAHWEEAA